MSADLARFATRLAALADTAWAALDDEHNDRQLLLEALIGDTSRLADQMRTASTVCDIPDCTEHPA